MDNTSNSNYILSGYEALSTQWFIEVFEPLTGAFCIEVRSAVEETISSFESKYSRFDAQSLLSELNSKQVVPYDYHLAQMLTLGKEMTIASGGIFNLFIKDALESKGYGLTTSPPSEEGEMVSDFFITEKEIALTGTKSVDLGGIGKGYLIDVIAHMMRDTYHVEQFLINGGGDMYGTHDNGNAIVVYLQHPKDRDMIIGLLAIKNQSLCSSSSYVRMWVKDGVTKNHFVTEGGKEVWAASFVVCSTAVVCDMLATVLCISSGDEPTCTSHAAHYGAKFLVLPEKGEAFGDLGVDPV